MSVSACVWACTHTCMLKGGVGWGRAVVAVFNIPELLCNHGCVGVGWRVEGQEWAATTGKQTWMPRCMQNKADACTVAPWEFHQAQEALKMLCIQGPPWSNRGKICIIIKFTWKSLRYRSKRTLFTWQSQSLKTSWRKRCKNLMVSPLEYNDYIS